ncbi:hypothetical protein [Rhizobium anhuiense]|uniref:hypothetical protein n=1 Tax=Rhizobium anhuiense TaxID=1184720 RepID=UPI003CC98EEF
MATATIASGINGLATGQTVSISGATQTECNGNVIITVTGPNSFTYNFAGSATMPATGTVSANDLYLRAEYQNFFRPTTRGRQMARMLPANGAFVTTFLRKRMLAATSRSPEQEINTYAGAGWH